MTEIAAFALSVRTIAIFNVEFSFSVRLQSKGCETAAPRRICTRSSPVPKAGSNHDSTKSEVGYTDLGCFSFLLGLGGNNSMKQTNNKQTFVLIVKRKDIKEWTTESQINA